MKSYKFSTSKNWDFKTVPRLCLVLFFLFLNPRYYSNQSVTKKVNTKLKYVLHLFYYQPNATFIPLFS